MGHQRYYISSSLSLHYTTQFYKYNIHSHTLTHSLHHTLTLTHSLHHTFFFYSFLLLILCQFYKLISFFLCLYLLVYLFIAIVIQQHVRFKQRFLYSKTLSRTSCHPYRRIYKYSRKNVWKSIVYEE